MHTISMEARGGWAGAALRPARDFGRAFGWTFGRGPGAAVSAGFALLLAWQERAEQRHALALLDDRMLKDIGLSRTDVQSEVSRPFWSA